MPKIVVNLLKLQEDIVFLTSTIEKNRISMDDSGHRLSTHSVENEIKYLETFKDSFELAIQKKQAELLNDRLKADPDACKKIKEADGILYVTDEYGNIFYPLPFEYSYVELTYGNYKKFQTVRFLGEAGPGFQLRFQFNNVKHNISPTTLSLLQNIYNIKEEYLEKNILEQSISYLSNIDKNCRDAKAGKKEKITDWKYFFQKYFYPSAKYEPKKGESPKFVLDNKTKFGEKDLSDFLREIKQNKEKIEESLRNKKLKTSADPKAENPAQGTKQDTNQEQKPEPQCPDIRQNLLQGLQDAINDIDKSSERQIENWKRRFDLSCILKDVKDCLIPPDLDFCDFLFKDISVPKFYQKLSLLKAAGLGDLYIQIENKLEEDFGVKRLKFIEKEIKNLEKLLEEEDQIRDRLNNALETFEEKSYEYMQEISSLQEKLDLLNRNLDIANLAGRQSEIDRLEKQKRKINTKLQQVKSQLSLLSQQYDNIPKNLETLNKNYESRRRHKENLKIEFSDKIAENKFNERQAQLIREGKNLEAIFLVPNEDEKYSSAAVATTIINAIDTIMPLENLCKTLFQISLVRDVKIQPFPFDFFKSFKTKFKDPFFGLSVDLGKMLQQLALLLLFNMLDSFLNSLCDSIGNVVANGVQGKNQFEDLTGEKIFSSIKDYSLQETEKVGSIAINSTANLTKNLLNQDMVAWFIENGQSSPFSQWDLSQDGKTFVIKNAPVFDFNQVANFIKTSINNSISAGEKITSQAWSDVFDKQEEPQVVLEEQPPVEQDALTVEEAKSELRCLLSRSISLLTPTETIALLTKKSDQNTKNIVNKIASICAPSMSNNYPGDSLVELIGEIGLLAGALEVEEKLQEISDLNNSLPITEKILCQRYDNTEAFRISLMSQTIDPLLAKEILDEINNKQQEQYGYIIDSISSLAEGNILEKPQTAKQFYLQAISQTLDLQQQGQQPKSLKDLQLQQNNTESKIDIKQVLQEKVNETQKSNAMLNSMFELTSESLIRPYRDRFRRDGENYINAISVDVPYEKEIEVQQEAQTPFGTQQIPNMEFLNITNMGYVPTLEITEGTVTILPEKNSKRQEAEQEKVTLLNSYENDINNYQYYQQLEENGLEEPQENARRDLEYIKNINLTPTEVNEIRDGSIADVEYKYSNQMSENKILFLVSGGSEKFKEFLRTLAEINANDVTKTFITSGVVRSNIKMKMLPSYVLPYSKKVGSKTILTNKIFSEDKNEGIILNANDGVLLLSNGYVEDNFIYNLYELSQKNTIKQNKKEVGQKYIDAVDTFSEKLQTNVTDELFNISISSRHKNNSLINDINGLIKETDVVDYDSVISNKVSLENLQCAIRNIDLGQALPTDFLNIINNDTVQQKLKEAIALWKIEYKENLQDDNTIQSEFSLKTSGLSFSPVGKYDKFYHDTIIESSINTVSDNIRAILMEKYNEVLGRYATFKRLLGVDFENIDVQNRLPQNQNTIQVVQNFSSKLYAQIFEEVMGKMINSLKDSELLKEDENKRKLVEFLDFTREQTDYEKENNLDPNIMNFISLKNYFQELYQIEKEDVLTAEQLRGEKSSDNKITKSAKNVLLLSLIRLCINEYILKNIFIFDILSYDNSIQNFDFIIKDISNFITQESKRTGIVKEIQSQSIKYYDLLVENNKINKKENIEEMVNDWKKSNSFSSVEANPKLVQLVKQEMSDSLEKFRKLLKCEDRNVEQKDSFVDLFIGSLDTRRCPYLSDDKNKLLYQKDSVIYNTYKEGTLYIEKYVRVPKMTEKGRETFQGRKKTEIEKYENSVIKLDELYHLINKTDMPLDQIYNCDSKDNLFEEPFVFGCRLMVITKRQQDVYSDINEYSSTSFSKKEKTGNVVYYENLDNNLDSITLFSNKQISKYETYFNLENLDSNNLLQSLNDKYADEYRDLLYPGLTKSDNTQLFFKYCFGLNELIQIFLSHSFLIHNDQDSRFLFEGTKMMITKMYQANMNSGNVKDTNIFLNDMLAEQKRNEDNTGNPLGPSLEAVKFFYRTPIQILRGQAGLVDPNVALADTIIKGVAMASSLTGQNINIPYSLASLALMPFPLFNGVVTPPPLTSYNIAMPLGPIFLALEDLLLNLPYYQNKDKGKLPSGDGKQNNSQNPLFCELSDEENDQE